ncbi:potassium channel family protein [Candidatus Poribacteria bacterium]|nr:potassium channel family protein [Candidatus Poribacteria bacterium]MYH79140.1 potassium channel family protein [Candidatus Poribacteria bacterium]MYK96347.1 potassium channel family protein [Candidatus Poribacteria bacterium]
MQIYHGTEQTLDARTFLSILHEDYESVFLTSCVIEGAAIFSTESTIDAGEQTVVNKEIVCIGCTFKNVVKFEKTDFQKEVFFGNSVFQEAVHFRGAVFQSTCDFGDSMFEGPVFFREAVFRGKANFRQTRFQRVADFNEVEFLENTVFKNAAFREAAHFSRASFRKELDFVQTHFSAITVFNHSTFLGKTDFTSAQFAVAASYRNVNYTPNTIWQWLSNKRKRQSEEPTEFYLDSEDINEVLNPFFKRHVADQQFIRAFKEQHPFWAQVWRWSSDYGRSLTLWALWSLLIALSFSLLYMQGPSWLPEGLQGMMPRFHQVTGENAHEPLTFWKSFYFSIVTFTTLGFGDVVADNTSARILVTLEVIFGYVMLGGLISIFANKLASRS